MTDDSSPQSDGAPSENTASSNVSHSLDFPAIFKAAKDTILKPLAVIDDIKSMVTDLGGYFSSKKDGSINDSLGFYLIIVAALIVCSWLSSILLLNFIKLIVTAPFVLFGSIVGLAIGSAILFVIAKFVAKGEGSFWESTQIACRLSWVF